VVAPIRHWRSGGHPGAPEPLLCGLAVDFHFDVVIQVVRSVPVAVEADVTGPGAFGVDEFALVGLNVVHIGADAETRRVVDIVVEQCPDIRDEVRGVGGLYDDIQISPRLLMVMPHHYGENLMRCFEIDSRYHV